MDFWDWIVRVRAVVLLVFQIALIVAGIAYLFVRGADHQIAGVLMFTLHSLQPAPVDRATVLSALVARLGKDRSPPGHPERDIRAS